jgi:uncharacterized Zn finger protein (UPF0148 family)
MLNQDNCAICLEKLCESSYNTVKLRCNHAYHANCIINAFQYTTLCPLCKKDHCNKSDEKQQIEEEEAEEEEEEEEYSVFSATQEELEEYVEATQEQILNSIKEELDVNYQHKCHSIEQKYFHSSRGYEFSEAIDGYAVMELNEVQKNILHIINTEENHILHIFIKSANNEYGVHIGYDSGKWNGILFDSDMEKFSAFKELYDSMEKSFLNEWTKIIDEEFNDSNTIRTIYDHTTCYSNLLSKVFDLS